MNVFLTVVANRTSLSTLNAPFLPLFSSPEEKKKMSKESTYT